MKIAISGCTGFIGQQLNNYLLQCGYEIIQISRNDFMASDDQLAKIINSADVIVNLAGSSVLCQWNQRNRENIYSSRINTTRKLVGAAWKGGPKLFINSSAIGIYDETITIHDESSTAFNSDFLASICLAWEKETQPLEDLNIRRCIIRSGIVLGTSGGSLTKILPVFRAGLGGRIGTGKQPFSFIHIGDFCRAIHHLIENEQSAGIYNFLSPEPTTNIEFTRVLAKRLHRPAIFRVPEFALKMIYGEAAGLLTKGVKVLPAKLIKEGFEFNFPDITSAIADLMGERS